MLLGWFHAETLLVRAWVYGIRPVWGQRGKTLEIVNYTQSIVYIHLAANISPCRGFAHMY